MPNLILSVLTLLAVIGLGVLCSSILALQKKNSSQTREIETLRNSLEGLYESMRDEFDRTRRESGENARDNRKELSNSFSQLTDALSVQLTRFSTTLRDLTNEYTQASKDYAQIQESSRNLIDGQLTLLRDENAKKLEEMRRTVDENLKDTVEKRFNDSFELISGRLEQVYRGLGEMQTLAAGVGDLKKVLTNVKTRGNMGEIQLGAILGEILSPSQYEAQVQVRPGSQERVDYAIKLPDKNEDGVNLLLPIDSKFPMEDYNRLMEAYESPTADDSLKRINGAFEAAVKSAAKSIADKYINPPTTTDFAVMFVPTEGLYAEICKRPALFEGIARSFKVTVVGPANLAAFLSSLQMGFRTLAIERRSNEVWQLLGQVKGEFEKFGTILDNVKKKLESASREIDTAGAKTRTITRRLRNVEEIASPEEEPVFLLEESE